MWANKSILVWLTSYWEWVNIEKPLKLYCILFAVQLLSYLFGSISWIFSLFNSKKIGCFDGKTFEFVGKPLRSWKIRFLIKICSENSSFKWKLIQKLFSEWKMAVWMGIFFEFVLKFYLFSWKFRILYRKLFEKSNFSIENSFNFFCLKRFGGFGRIFGIEGKFYGFLLIFINI